MSDYMFMLESHLTSHQNRALSVVVNSAQEAGLNLFLSGGAARDMFGGFPVRDLDFVVEGNPQKLVKALQKGGGAVSATDEVRKQIECLFPSGVTVGIAMSASEKYAKTGGKAQITPAPIYDHLRSRDFTVNAIALSLGRGSRGLLIDPTNGMSDLNQRELRAISNHGLYDNPSRILRLVRLQVRLGFAIEARTQQQYANARKAEVEKYITPADLRMELLRSAGEPNPVELLKAMEREHLLPLFSPALAGAKVNHAGFQKLQKGMQLIPYGVDFHVDWLGLFLLLFTEKLSVKERATLVKATGLTKQDLNLWQRLEPRAKKLERLMMSPKLGKASQVYATLSAAPGDEILYLLCRSEKRLVLDRLRNHLQKYLMTAHEVTDADIIAKGGQPGTLKFEAIRRDFIAGRLDGRIRKPAPPPVPEPVPVAAVRRFN